ncbi:cyclic nucleotide-binding domain-containing protein [Hahella ganghwensis]|uniref:cyclic nucleotide-binding domain-containing protein n=1 Tax=Hahella ganghwensis TaxID=286420 RepID=UPI000380B9A2|nr:cyclic nucleotide-binding domain-containing protein [Hahella ganghwensis]
MQFLDSSSEKLTSLGANVTQASVRLFNTIKLVCENIEIDETDDLYREFEGDYLYFVESGELDAVTEESAVYSFDQGDLIGIQILTGFPVPIIRTMGPVTLARIDKETFKEVATGSLQFKDYLLQLSAFFAEACCHGLDSAPETKTSFRTYKEGEVIIHEGDPAEEVFDLISGRATVYVQEQEVGQVSPGEIFGAMAALTKTPRTATVVANRPCTVMAVPMEEFTTLIRNQPRTCLALLENMAKQILDLNQKLVDVLQKH